MSTDYADLRRFCFLICVICVTCGSSFAQPSSPPKRKKLKDFGSSLKRLKSNPDKKAAGELHGVAIDEDDVIRIDTSLVSCELLVLDERGNSVSGLTAEDFSIAEDGAPQTVGHFLKGDNLSVPRTIVLIIDYSGSQEPYLKNSVNAAKILVDKLGPKDLMAIVTDDVQMIQDFTTDKKKLKKKLDSLLDDGKGGTGNSKQYSALMATLNEAFTEGDVRPIIIFQTDGDEAYFLENSVIKLVVPEGLDGQALELAQRNVEFHRREHMRDPPQFSLDDLYHAVEKSHATVYTVIPGVKLLGFTREEQVDRVMADKRARLVELMRTMLPAHRGVLEDRFREDKNSKIIDRWMAERISSLQFALAGVAPLTGGWTEFLETPEQAEAIYARVFSDINQRYIIGYYPTNKRRDGTRRKIDFGVSGHPEYQLYGRRSYFAPGP